MCWYMLVVDRRISRLLGDMSKKEPCCLCGSMVDGLTSACTNRFAALLSSPVVFVRVRLCVCLCLVEDVLSITYGRKRGH